MRILSSLGAAASVLVLVSTGHPAVHSVGVRAGDPLYREMRRLAAAGLLDEPLHGYEPLSRAEIYRLLRPAARSGDPRTRRVLEAVAPWKRYLDPDLREVIAEGGLRELGATGSDIRGGRRAPNDFGYGIDRFEGVSAEAELSLVAEDREFSFDGEGRLRFDDRDAFLRPVVFAVLTEWGNARFAFGREPLAWGPGVRANLLLSTNARPLDQVRVETASPFRLPGPLARIGAIRASAFLAHLDDPGRAVPDPWLFGHRSTLAPFPWLVLGATRTIMLGGKGNRFHPGLESVWDLLTAKEENDYLADENTDQRMSLDWSLSLAPVLRRTGWIDGGRFYGEYGGEDNLRGFPPTPAAPAIMLGMELVVGPVLARAEGASDVDDTALWYWHGIYTDGYTYRDRYLGNPMGGDSRSLYVDLECEAGAWGLVTLGWARKRHGYEALPGIAPKYVDPPVPQATEDGFRVAVEAYRGAFPGAVTVEARYLSQSGDRLLQGPEERWGASVTLRTSRW